MLQLPPILRSQRPMPAALALLLWASAVGTLTLWVLHLPRNMGQHSAATGSVASAQTRHAPAAIERALGHASIVSATPDMQKRAVLLGVIAGSTGQGSALIRVDDQPPKAFLLGQEVSEGWYLKSVTSHSATVNNAGRTLELPLSGYKKD